MLGFLQNKNSNRLPSKALQYKPSLVYGHTAQSPSHFCNQHTIYYQSSQKTHSLHARKPSEGLPAIHQDKAARLQRNSSSNLETFNISAQHRNQKSREAQQKKSNQHLTQQKIDFNLTKGEFSIFLDNHKHHSNMGIIYKQGNSLHTKQESRYNSNSKSKLTWNKSSNIESKSNFSSSMSKQKLTLKSQNQTIDKDSIMQTKQSSLWLARSNSISIFEKSINKYEVRSRRDQFNEQIKTDMNLRRTAFGSFGLPRLGVQHQLMILEKHKYVREKPKNQMQQINQDLDKFQNSLFQKLK